MRGKFDPWSFVAAAAIVATLAITFHSRGFSNREIALYCGLSLAVMPLCSFSFWFATRLMPSSDSLSWWQWFTGRNFLSSLIGNAILFGVASLVTLAVGQHSLAVGTGVACLVCALLARWQKRRLYRKASQA
jgi:hypothetical protein